MEVKTSCPCILSGGIDFPIEKLTKQDNLKLVTSKLISREQMNEFLPIYFFSALVGYLKV